MRITWLGHSTVVIEAGGVRLVTDPLLRSRVGHLRRTGGVPSVPEDVDAVLISHTHYDHLDIPSLRLLGRAQKLIVPRGAAGMLRRRGFGDVSELVAGEELTVGGLAVRATHAEHASRRAVLTGVPSLGYIVSGGRRLYFAGDTGVFAGMADLSRDLDVALLPVAGWGRRLPPGHLDAAGAVDALKLLRPHAAVPIHWGTYRQIGLGRTRDELAAPVESFRRLAAAATPEVQVHLLPIGGTVDLAGPTS